MISPNCNTFGIHSCTTTGTYYVYRYGSAERPTFRLARFQPAVRMNSSVDAGRVFSCALQPLLACTYRNVVSSFFFFFLILI